MDEIKLIDTHCHLDFQELMPRIDEIIKNAKYNHVHEMVTISTNLNKINMIKDLSEKYDEISKTGQVFITLITPNKSITKEYFLDGDRLENIKKTVDFSINLLHENLSI